MFLFGDMWLDVVAAHQSILKCDWLSTAAGQEMCRKLLEETVASDIGKQAQLTSPEWL